MPNLPPAEIEHLYHAGWAALQRNGLSEAEENFLSVLAADPEHHDSLNGLGTVYFHEKRLEEAESLYRKANSVLLNKFYGHKLPDHVDWDAPHDKALLRSLHGLALTAYRRGDTKQALAGFEQLVKLNPKDNTGARFLIADITKKGRTNWDQGRDV